MQFYLNPLTDSMYIDNFAGNSLYSVSIGAEFIEFRKQALRSSSIGVECYARLSHPPFCCICLAIEALFLSQTACEINGPTQGSHILSNCLYSPTRPSWPHSKQSKNKARDPIQDQTRSAKCQTNPHRWLGTLARSSQSRSNLCPKSHILTLRACPLPSTGY